jgi:hypothetical protein
MMVFRSERCGLKPSPDAARDASATRMAGSPGRRGPKLMVSCSPVSAAIASTYLLDGKSAAGPEIEEPAASVFEQTPQACDVRIGEIGDVNIVPDRGAVRRRIVVSKNREVGDVTLDRHHRSRNEMGLRIGHLADFRATCVEISERDELKPVSARIVAEDAFDHQLR